MPVRSTRVPQKLAHPNSAANSAVIWHIGRTENPICPSHKSFWPSSARSVDLARATDSRLFLRNDQKASKAEKQPMPFSTPLRWVKTKDVRDDSESLTAVDSPYRAAPAESNGLRPAAETCLAAWGRNAQAFGTRRDKIRPRDPCHRR